VIKNKNIAFVGSGFMGGALIRGLVESGAVKPSNITATDPRESVLKNLAKELGIKTSSDNSEAVADAGIVVLAVKPQVLESVVKSLKGKLGRKKLIISIAAGVKTGAVAQWLSSGAKVVRAMPNMGATIGLSATALCAGDAANEVDIAIARQIFDSVGESVVVEEKLMDAVTGLSGSGPAFVFAFLEGLIDAGVRCGLTRETATVLARQTLYGAAKMARDLGEHPSLLKERITSPGGTTIAGLTVLEEAGFRGLIIRAVEKAVERSKELGG